MIFETIFENNYGGEIDLPSPQPGHRFKIFEGDKVSYKSTNPLGVFSRYSRIIFLKGHEKYVKLVNDPALMSRKLQWRGLKLVVRKDWQEPKRTWPTIWMINKSDCPLQIVSPDTFDRNNKVFLFWDIPVLCSVQCYSSFAEWKKYEIGIPERQLSQKVGSIPGSYEMLENNVLSGKRSEQELRRLSKMMSEWRETQRNQIRII